MNESKKNFIDEYKNDLGINIANTIIVSLAIIAMIAFLIVGYIYLAKGWGDDIVIGSDWDTGNEIFMNQWSFLFLLPICSLAALAGIISVVASNNKAPITLLILSSISTIYKFSYAVVQLATHQEAINSSVLIGQPVMFFLLFVQVYYWVKWNKVTDEGKFISETFKGNRTYIALTIIGFIWVGQMALSIWMNGFGLNTFVDVLGGMLYTIAAILMAFGNILCFPFFFLSDLSWLYWTIKDLGGDNLIMVVFAYTTLIEVLSYTALAITGFIQWFMDDYEFVGAKIQRKENRKTQETQI